MNLHFFQELEDQLKVKEKEVEKVEQIGLSLIQNKKEEVCVAVMDTLQKLNHSWANLDHRVSKYEYINKDVNVTVLNFTVCPMQSMFFPPKTLVRCFITVHSGFFLKPYFLKYQQICFLIQGND